MTKPVGLNLDRREGVDGQKNSFVIDYNNINYLNMTTPMQTDELSFIPHSPIVGSRETSDNYTFFSSGTENELGLKYIDNFIVNNSSPHEIGKYSSRKILSNIIKYSEYEEPSLDEGDQAWLLDSEVNQN